MKFFIVFYFIFTAYVTQADESNSNKLYQELADFYFLKKYTATTSHQLNQLSIKIKGRAELAHYQPLIQKAFNLSKSNTRKTEDCTDIINTESDRVYQLIAKKVYQICTSTIPKTLTEKDIKAVDDKKYIRDKFVEYYEKAGLQIKDHKYTSAYYWAEQAVILAKKIDEERSYLRAQFLGKDFLRYRRFDYAIKVFKNLLEIENFPEPEELHKLILVAHNASANYNRGLRHIEKSDLLNESKNLGSGVLFWIGKTQLKAGQKNNADKTFKRLITEHPISFYSTLVIHEHFEKSFFDNRTPASIPDTVLLSSFESQESKYSTLRLEGFVATNNIKFAEEEVIESSIQHDLVYKALPESDEQKPKLDKSQFDFLVLQNTLNILEKLDSRLTAFKVIYDFLDQHPQYLHREIFTHLFPVPYSDEIKKIDSTIDKNLVISLIRQESAFNPSAYSSAGAMGLMQLMPATARRMNKKISKNNLKNPSDNISVGTQYLDYLLDMFQKNPMYALASYNAGENRVKQWIKDYLHKGDALTALELIPYKETRMYVKLIYRNYFFYRDLDLGSKSKIDFKFKII